MKPLGPDNEHPGYASLARGQQHVADLVGAVQSSRYWADTAIIITYDEHGGSWDHVAPPPGDKWGPGSRVPAIIISPYARKGYVDHTQYDTTSILKFIETRCGLQSLGARDAAANDLTSAFDFNAGPGRLPSSGDPAGLELPLIAGLGFVLVAIGTSVRRRSGRGLSALKGRSKG